MNPPEDGLSSGSSPAAREDSAFRTEQRRVAARVAAAILVTIVVVAVAVYSAHGAVHPLDERIATALTADLFVVLWLFAAIANVARLRFFSPDDIAGSGGVTATAIVRRADAVLQNTLEQAVLAGFVYLAIAAVLARPEPLIIALVCLFTIGRALFWSGYAKGAGARAFGFALTFYPTGVAALIAIVSLATGWLR